MAQHTSNGAMYDCMEVPFSGVIEWEECPTLNNPYRTTITFYGYTRFQQAYARYEGRYGTWEIDLSARNGLATSLDEATFKPCTRTWGKARCITSSNEWRETPEERRKRLRSWIEEEIL